MLKSFFFSLKSINLCCKCNGNSQKKYDSTAPPEILMKIWLQQKWPNWGRRMTKLGEESQEALVKTFVRKILTKMAKTGPVGIEDSKYTPFCMSKSFFRCENDLQSWNPTFLSIRSPNPLPKASGLENLTSGHWLTVTALAREARSPFGLARWARGLDKYL